MFEVGAAALVLAMLAVVVVLLLLKVFRGVPWIRLWFAEGVASLEEGLCTPPPAPLVVVVGVVVGAVVVVEAGLLHVAR